MRSIYSGITVILAFSLILLTTTHCTKEQTNKVLAAFLSFQCNGLFTFNTEDVHLDEDGICTTEISFSFENGQWVWFCLDDVAEKTYQLTGGNYATVRMDNFSTNEIGSTDGTITLHDLDKPNGNYDASFNFNASDPGTCLTINFSGTASIRDGY